MRRKMQVSLMYDQPCSIGVTDSEMRRQLTLNKHREVLTETVELFGITFHNVVIQDLMALIAQRIMSGKPGYIITPNVDHICQYQKNANLRDAYSRSFLVLADGTPVIWASRLLGKPLKQKLSGSDLVFWIPEYLAENGYSVFLFGAAEGVADEAAKILLKLYPNLKVAGTYSPELNFENDPDASKLALQKIAETSPDLCMVALGCPKQELWMSQYCEKSGVPVMIGVGGSFDLITGNLKRAPVWMQKAGVEWIWRLCQEPRRLWKRYLIDDMHFLIIFCGEFVRNMIRRFSR